MFIGRSLPLCLASLVLPFTGCDMSDDSQPNVSKTDARTRAIRRAYDGAPPVIPHPPFGPCTECHSEKGREISGVGFAPPNPHFITSGGGKWSRCRQCHVFSKDDSQFVDSTFVGLKQDLRRGAQQHPFSPPVIPHQVLLRENCLACHSGPSAREEIRCSHPERTHCTQCHVERQSKTVFARAVR